MNSKKLLTLSATLLMALTVASCKTKKDNNTSSSSSSAPTSEVGSSSSETSNSSSSANTSSSASTDTSSSTSDASEEALWTAWAESVWDLYKEKNNSQVTGSFDVSTIASTRDDDGNVHTAKVIFALEVTKGSTDAFKLNDKDDTHKTVYVGYYDEKVTEESTVKITISLEYNGNTRTISDILSNDKGVLNFTTPVLKLDNHAAWAEWTTNDDTKKNRVYNIKGTVIDVITKESGSKSAGSFYMVDSEGYGYYVYKPAGDAPEVGDEVIVTGKRSDYSGQEEFAEKATFAVTKKGDTSKVTFKDASTDFAAAKSAKITDESLGAKYQNIPVTIEGCVPLGKSDATHYTFKVGNGSAVFSLYDTDYFLSDAQRDAYIKVYNDAMESGHTLTISGICVSFNNEYQIYGTTLKSDAVITKGAEMTAEQKAAVARSAIEAKIEETYDANTTIEFALPKYVTASFTVKNENPTVAVNEGKLVVTPTNREVENTITVSLDAGGETPTTFDIKIVTEDNSVTKYTGRFDYETFKVDTTETTAKVTSKKDPTQSENIKFTHSAIIDNAEHKEFNLAKETGFMTMTAPEGYTIAKVELKTYYDNFVVYAGTDATGTELEKTNVVVSGRNYTYTVEVNGASVYIANPSTHDASVYYVDVTLTKPNTGEEVAHKLTIGKADIKVLDSTQKSYAQFNGAQTIGDYKVNVTNVMPNTFGAMGGLDIFQLKAEAGTMSIEGTFSKITLVVANTKDYTDTNALSVYFGEEKITIDSATVNAARVDSGKKDNNNTVYLYTVVVDFGEEKTGTFSIKKETKNVAYLTSIIFD